MSGSNQLKIRVAIDSTTPPTEDQLATKGAKPPFSKRKIAFAGLILASASGLAINMVSAPDNLATSNPIIASKPSLASNKNVAPNQTVAPNNAIESQQSIVATHDSRVQSTSNQPSSEMTESVTLAAESLQPSELIAVSSSKMESNTNQVLSSQVALNTIEIDSENIIPATLTQLAHEKVVTESTVIEVVQNELEPSTLNAPFNSGNDNVVRALLTREVQQLEPVGQLNHMVEATGAQTDKLYYFTEFENMNGQTVTHRWLYQGKSVAELDFKVKSDKWRLYSSKNIPQNWTGEWKVEVLNQAKQLVATADFEYRSVL